MDIKGFPNNIDLNPESYREFALVKNFRDPRSGVTLNVDEFTLVREAKQRLEDWIYLEQGRFENVPVTITTDAGLQIPFFLDLSTTQLGLNRANVGIQCRKSEAHFFQDADFLTFELLKQKGGLPGSLEYRVPYIVVPDDVPTRTAIATVQTLVTSYTLYQATFEFTKAISNFVNSIGGAGAAGVVAGLKLAAAITYFALSIGAFIQAVNDLKELIFPTLRFFKAFRDLDLIDKGCEYLGYTLDSTVLSNELKNFYTLGRPEVDQNNSIFKQIFAVNNDGFFNKGYPTAQDTTPTLGSLIQFYLDTFNLKIFVYDGIVKIEKRSFFINNSTINLIPTLTNQEESDDEYTFNEDEVWGRAYDHWQVDYTDLHSPDIDDGIQSEKITQSLNPINPDLVRLTGLKENSAPYALGERKEGYNAVEEVFITLFGLMDSLINSLKVFGGTGGSSLANLITQRNGVLVIEKDYFSVTKKLYAKVENGLLKQTSDYKTKLSMKTIYNNFKLDLELPVNNYRVKEMTVPFTDENFIDLIQNNFVNYQEPNQPAVKAEVKYIEWFDRQYKANIIILIPDNSAFNTEVITLV